MRERSEECMKELGILKAQIQLLIRLYAPTRLVK